MCCEACLQWPISQQKDMHQPPSTGSSLINPCQAREADVGRWESWWEGRMVTFGQGEGGQASGWTGSEGGNWLPALHYIPQMLLSSPILYTQYYRYTTNITEYTQYYTQYYTCICARNFAGIDLSPTEMAAAWRRVRGTYSKLHGIHLLPPHPHWIQHRPASL